MSNVQDKPLFSVIIGLVSTEDDQKILDCLAALGRQQGNFNFEVILADRKNDVTSHLILQRFPDTQLLQAESNTSLPTLRSMALNAAIGHYIVVTEDHCIPDENWLQEMRAAFDIAPECTLAVGGCIQNGCVDTAFDWANFFCEYCTFLPPVANGQVSFLPGMNIAYKRSVFDDVDPAVLHSGFWETTLHPRLLKQQGAFYSSNTIVLTHSKRFSRRFFLQQRFLYSRYYAGNRFPGNSWLKRTFATLLSPFLPLLLFGRILNNVARKKTLRKEPLCSIPDLLLCVSIWSLGEMWGYASGPGQSLRKIE